MNVQQLNEADSMGDLGMQNTELMNQYAAYLEMARLTGQVDPRTMAEKGRELGQSFTNLVVESTALASLTKLSRNEALATQLAALSDVRLAAGTSTLRDMGLDNQAETIENLQKQLSLIAAGSEGPGRQVFENIAEAMNSATLQYSNNIENFDILPTLDSTTVATLQTVAPGLIDTINTKVREGTLTGDGVQSFLLNELQNVDTTRFLTTAADGPGAEILGFQGTILRIKKDFAAVIGKGEEEMKKLNETTKTKLEAAGTTVEAMNDAAKIFLTAQEAITLNINTLSVGVEAVSEWFEKNTSLVKNQATKFFNGEVETEYSSENKPDEKPVVISDNIVSENDPYFGYHNMGKAMAEHYSNQSNSTSNNAVVSPVIPDTTVQNRTTDNLNNQLTSYKDHVNILSKNLTEAKKKDIELYQKQIDLIQAELDAREKKENQELREKLKHFSQ